MSFGKVSGGPRTSLFPSGWREVARWLGGVWWPRGTTGGSGATLDKARFEG